MKKLTYLFVAAAALSMAACNGNKPGYVVIGSVEGGVDGDTVYLQEVVGRQLVNLDTAVIANGTFTFEGMQDSTVTRYISSGKGNDVLRIDFFLENGAINVALTKHNDSATGTPNNDAYQEIRSQVNVLSDKANKIQEAMADTSLTEEQKTANMEEMSKLEEEYDKIQNEGMKKNITNIVGVNLFKQNFYNLSIEDKVALLEQIPEQYQNDEAIIKIKEMTEKQKKTAAGQKFIDFEMQTPDGKPVKLSDYVGKGKIVLIDFWASWCGPCRREMPNLVEAYAKYKDKNFEIVGVSLDEDATAWKDAIGKLNITWPQMSDLKGWSSAGAQLYAINSIPHVVLIDGEGTIIARGLHGEELQAKLAEVIK